MWKREADLRSQVGGLVTEARSQIEFLMNKNHIQRENLIMSHGIMVFA